MATIDVHDRECIDRALAYYLPNDLIFWANCGTDCPNLRARAYEGVRIVRHRMEEGVAGCPQQALEDLGGGADSISTGEQVSNSVQRNERMLGRCLPSTRVKTPTRNATTRMREERTIIVNDIGRRQAPTVQRQGYCQSPQ